jgi:hypothetical protein
MNKWIVLCFLLMGLRVMAQDITTANLLVKKAKVEKLDDLITLKFTQSSDIEKLAVITGSRDIKLSPNAATISGLSFSWRFIYFGISYVPKFLPGNNDNATKGKTRSGGLNFSLNFSHWFNEFTYNRTKGYYLENTRDFDPVWTPGQPYKQFPQLVFTQFQGLTAYNFNPQYSLSAITFQTERQLKSAGSFIPQFRYRYYINDDQSAPSLNGFTQKAKNLELLLGAGYYYTLVAQTRWYISLGLTPNAGYHFSRIYSRSATTTLKGNQHNFIFRMDGRVGAGYNSRRFFAGAYMNVAASSYNQQHSSVVTEDDRVAVQAFIGYRLQAPKWMKATLDKLTKKVGLD